MAKAEKPAEDTRAKYRVLVPSYINDRYISQEEVDAGFEIFYDGIPGSALEPVNEAALEAKAAAPVPKEPAL
jgi:hypothetical protein